MNRLDSPVERDAPRAAADWRVRLESGEATEETWIRFTAWLEEHPAHRAAFDDVEAAVADVDAHRAELLEAVTDRETLPVARIIRFPFWARATAASALAASILVAFILARSPAETAAWSTHIGERRDVDLADGSAIHLNSATSVSISFDRDQRLARIEDGEALFEVASNAKRPFIVIAGDQRIRVVGTGFDVLRHDGAVVITVAHGVVEATVDGTAAKTARLTAGDQYRRKEGQPTFSVASVDATTVTAWREGRLAYDNAPLSEVVADLNRNFSTQVSLGDDAVANLRFTGDLKLDDVREVIRRLEAFLPISSHPEGNGIVVTAKTAP